MSAMKEILLAAKSGNFEILDDGRVALFTNPATREGYILERDEFDIGLELKDEYRNCGKVFKCRK
jgi:hypothetical protein